MTRSQRVFFRRPGEGIGLAVFLVAALLGPVLARAQNDLPIRLQFGSPVFMRLENHRWTTWPLSLENRTNAPARLRVVLPMPGRASRRIEFQKDLLVPAGMKRTTRLAVRPGELPEIKRSRPGRSTGGRFVQQARLVDIASAEELQRQELPIVVQEADTFALLTLRGRDLIEGDTTSYLQELSNSPFGKVTLLSASLENLPARWFGYQQIDLIILGSARPDELLPGQWAALRNWVRQGGTIILASGAMLEPLLNGPLADLAGVRCVGAHPVDAFTVPALSDSPVQLPQPLPMAHLAVTDAKVLFEVDSLPLLTARTCGQGRVLTLALPIGALESPRLHDIFSRIGSLLKTDPPFDVAAFGDLAPDKLQEIAGRQAPPAALPVWILAGLAGAVLVVGLALSVPRRGEWLWLVLVPVALLVSAGLWAWGVSRRDPPRLSHLGLIQDLGNGQLRIEEAFDFYSGPTDEARTFTSGSIGGTIRPMGGGATDRMSVQAVGDLGHALTLRNVAVRPDSSYGFFVDAVRPGRVVDARLRFARDGVAGTLHNALDETIRSAVLFANGQVYHLGDIPSGEDVRIAVTPGDAIGQGEYTAAVMQDTRRNELVSALRSPRQFGHVFRRDLLLIGYVDSSLIEPIGEQDLARQGFSVVFQSLTIAPGRPGQAVTVPAGFGEMDIRNIGSPVYNPYRDEFNPNPRDGEVELWLDPGQDLAAASVELTVGISASNFRMTVGGVVSPGKASRREPVRTIANPAGRFTIRIDQAERFTAPDGRIVLYLAVEKNPGGVMANQPAGTVTWQITSMQAVVKGTVR